MRENKRLIWHIQRLGYTPRSLSEAMGLSLGTLRGWIYYGTQPSEVKLKLLEGFFGRPAIELGFQAEPRKSGGMLRAELAERLERENCEIAGVLATVPDDEHMAALISSFVVRLTGEADRFGLLPETRRKFQRNDWIQR